MSVSKAQMAANKKHDQTHFKYQSVKLKMSEYEQLKEAVEISKEPMNTFLRSAIMKKVSDFVQSDEAVPDETPNAETLEAFTELDNGGGHSFSGTTEQLFSELMENEKK